MKNIFKLLVVILPIVLISMFATGCDNGTSNNGKDTIYVSTDTLFSKDTVYINTGTKDTVWIIGDTIYIGKKDTIYTGGGTSGKELFKIWIDRDTINKTYYFSLNGNSVYPLPKLLINGNKVDDVYLSSYGIGFNETGISAGDLTYSIIWNDDTLTRTINLPNNVYALEKGIIGNDSICVVKGGNGDEKIIWSAYNSEYEYIRDTLQITENFTFPDDYKFGYSSVQHKDFKPISFGYTATVETKKIAVWEDISLWEFEDY